MMGSVTRNTINFYHGLYATYQQDYKNTLFLWYRYSKDIHWNTGLCFFFVTYLCDCVARSSFALYCFSKKKKSFALYFTRMNNNIWIRDGDGNWGVTRAEHPWLLWKKKQSKQTMRAMSLVLQHIQSQTVRSVLAKVSNGSGKQAYTDFCNGRRCCLSGNNNWSLTLHTWSIRLADKLIWEANWYGPHKGILWLAIYCSD